MHRSKTIANKIASDSVRSKGEKWTQDEMETLVSLCATHGRSGILSKETNKSTISKKDAQWATIMGFFNSLHPPRDKKALVGRYKYIVMHLRKNNALERRNVSATGGGLNTLNKEKTPFEITGTFLELSNVLGLSITGLPGYGSDSQALETSNDTPLAGQIEPGTTCSFQDAVKDHWTELVMDREDSLPKTIPVESELVNNKVLVNSEADSVPPADLSATVASMSPTPIPSRSQFFPTQTQRRANKRNIGAVSDANSERRKDEKHAAMMKYDAILMEAKIKELRQKETDRQLERDRSAELHKLEIDRRAMMIHQQETLFSIHKEVLFAQRDAFARVSPENLMLLQMPTDGFNLTSIRVAESVDKSDKNTE